MANTKEIKIDKDLILKFIKSKSVSVTTGDGDGFFTGTIMIRNQSPVTIKLGGGLFNIHIKFAEPNKRQIQMNKGIIPMIEYKPSVKNTKTTDSNEETNKYAEKAKEMTIDMDVILYNMTENATIFTDEPIMLTSEDKNNIYIDFYATCVSDKLVILTYNITFDAEEETTKTETTTTTSEE